MTEADAVQAWKSSALEDIKLGEDLLMQGKNAHSLFFLHLAIEKIIKGVHQHLKHEPSLFIHDLYKLATKAGIEVPESEKLELREKLVREVFKIITMTDSIAISKKFISELATAGIQVSKAYLYGSYAKGNAKSYSDIDICVVSPSFGKDMVDEMVKLRQISRRVDDRIEALPFGMDDIDNPYDPLATEIRRFGQSVL